MAAIKFSKQSIQPNPTEVDYWVDITSNPYGGNIKYFNGYDWVDLLNAKGKPVNLDAYYNKLQMNQMLAEKASVESVNSKVDDTEVADVIKNIEFKDRGDEGVEMVVLKYDGMTVGVTLPTASNTTSGIITNKSFKDLVKQNQLQGVYSEMYDKLSEIRQQYQRKLKAGKNIQIDENNTIHAVGEISLDWNDVYNKPDFDKLFATVALAIQSESNRAKNAEQQLSARITDHVDVVEGKLELKADANNVYTKDQIDEKISGIYKIKGSRTFQDLPTSGNSIGDVYNITNNFALDGVEYPFGTNVVYTATGWDALAGIFDSTEIENKVDEIDTKVDKEIIRAKEKELELDKKFDDYLPLSGGTLTKSLDTSIIVFNNEVSMPYINFKYKKEKVGEIGVTLDKQLVFNNASKWNNILHEGNYSDYALPLTGGTINGNIIVNSKNDTPLVLSGDTSTWISFINKDGNQLGWFGVKYDRQPYFFNTASYKIWHSGNDGSGSGLDADTLDGKHAADLIYFNTDIDTNNVETYRHIGYGQTGKGWPNNGAALQIGVSKYFMMLQGIDNNRLVYNYCYNGEKGNWKTIAFTDSDITGNAASASYVKLLDEITTDSFYNYIGDYAKGITAFSNKTDQAIGNIGLYDTVLNVGSTGDRFFRLLSKKNGDLRYQTPVNNANAWGPERTIIDSENVAQYTKHFYDLYGGVEIPANADLNDYKTVGTYCIKYDVNAASVANLPIAGAGTIKVFMSNGGTEYVIQEYIPYTGNMAYRRRYQTNDKQWRRWVLISTDLDNYNAPTATKLQTPIELWGNNFDGSSSVNGSIYFKNNSSLYIADNQNNPTNVLVYNDSNVLALGYSSSGKGHGTSIFGSPVTFYTGTDRTYRMIINSIGNVGIGTTDPQYTLDVNGLCRVKRSIIINNNEAFLTFDTTGHMLPVMQLNANDNLRIGSGTASYGHNTYVSGNNLILTYGASNTTGLILNSSGNVTIGESDLASTNFKLYVNGSLRTKSIDIINTGHITFRNTKNETVTAMYFGEDNDLLIGHGLSALKYNTALIGYKLYFQSGTNRPTGAILNELNNFTIGSSDLAGSNYKLYVDGKSYFKNIICTQSDILLGHDKEGIYLKDNTIMVHDPDNKWIASSVYFDQKGNVSILHKLTISEDLGVKNAITSGDLVDWYGVSWSEDSSDPTCTRIGNMALHRSLPILSAMKRYSISNRTFSIPEAIRELTDDGRLKYGISNNDTHPVETGDFSQNIMVKIPEFWYTDDYEPSTKTHNLKISQTAKAGWIHHKEAYIGSYEGYNALSIYMSTKNVIPTVSQIRKQLRTAARANGYEDEYKWNIYTYEEHRAICHLFLVEYATRNSQAPVNTALTSDGFKQGGLGSGCTTGAVTINGQTTYSFIPTGTTDSLGNGSGQVAYTVTQTDADGNEIGTVTRYANRYRGIENPFGHIWKHVDDIVNVYHDGSGNKTVYKCNKPEHFATNKNAKYKPLCSFPGGSKMQGWSKEIKATINCDFFKYSVGGSESTYWCDYNYDNDDTSEHCLLIGGCSDYGGGAGLFFFYLNSSVGLSAVSLGSRLTYLPWAE